MVPKVRIHSTQRKATESEHNRLMSNTQRKPWGTQTVVSYTTCTTAAITSDVSENILLHFLDENFHLGVFLEKSGSSPDTNTKPKSINLTSLSV